MKGSRENNERFFSVSPCQTERLTPETFFRRNSDLKQIKNSTDKNFIIFGSRKIGKSSLIMEAKKILDDAGVNSFYIDLESSQKQYHKYTDVKAMRIEELKNIMIKLRNADRYKKIKEIGRGAMGTVYKAKDLKLKRVIALKILNRDVILGNSDLDLFFSEAEKVAQLQHPNIVTVYDVGQMDDDYFISMEFIEGITLSTLIKKNHPISFGRILIIAKKLFSALAHSHQKGIIHRDIKPSNIMITSENEVKMLDFGIAAFKDDLIKENKNVILGTPYYMSPEQIESSAIDHQTDIYSSGVTLFHLVTGRTPFTGPSNLEVMEKHLREPIPTIKEYRSDIPKKIIQIIEKCMEKNKENRYQNAHEVLEEIYKIDNIKEEITIP